jgi:hypothetical protein
MTPTVTARYHPTPFHDIPSKTRRIFQHAPEVNLGEPAIHHTLQNVGA